MLKKALVLLSVSTFLSSSLVACNSTNQLSANLPVVQQNQQQGDEVVAASLKGIWSEIDKRRKVVFANLDANNDGKVEPKEYVIDTPDQAKAFNTIDKNGDGIVTQKEWMPNVFNKVALTIKLRSTARSLFGQLDANKDSIVSLPELDSGLISHHFSQNFAEFNTEKQGKVFNRKTDLGLTKSEFENLYASIAMRNVKNTDK